ncbi:MAG: prefoldin subunit alpha [Candidatus Micrarchaeia archaeon]
MTENNTMGIEELRYLQQLYEQQYRMVTDAINVNSNELAELSAVQNALDKSELMDNKEMLTYIGSGVYLKSKALDTKTFVLSIGGGYLVEMSLDYAKEYVAKRLEKKSAELNSAMNDRKKVELSLLDVMHKLDLAK